MTKNESKRECFEAKRTLAVDWVNWQIGLVRRSFLLKISRSKERVDRNLWTTVQRERLVKSLKRAQQTLEKLNDLRTRGIYFQLEQKSWRLLNSSKARWILLLAIRTGVREVWKDSSCNGIKGLWAGQVFLKVWKQNLRRVAICAWLTCVWWD